MFPEIHLWCDTSAGVYSQHSSQSFSPNECFSRGRMLDLNHRPPAWQADVLTTRPQRPGITARNLNVERSAIEITLRISFCFNPRRQEIMDYILLIT